MSRPIRGCTVPRPMQAWPDQRSAADGTRGHCMDEWRWLTEADLGRASNEDELFKQLTLRANILLILQFLKRELGHTVIGNLIGSVPSRFNTPTPGMDLMSQDLYSQTQSRLEHNGDSRRRGGRKGRKVEEEGQAVHQNDCGATRADAGAAGEAEGVQGVRERVQQTHVGSRRRARHLSARYKLLNTATPDPVDSPKHVVDGNVDHDDHLGLHPAHHTRAVLLFPRQADRPLHGGYTPTTADNAAFVFFIQFAALALENLFLAVRAAIALSTASAQIDTEFGAIKLKVGFILIFDDIIGLKMQQSIYLRSEAYPSISTHPY
ncbi:hypothetical protein BLNAU_3491 [Blattamonas nauphoetae]|uniref:Uncharacterized protein n=1 Tax=Blattamonas nauphoetae TaxID=2049346 RepID=A0ABQ9YCE3_9EUKA|nr:hypothetical protein BLNAU_3491 [Blattamonas nauphoetae]